MKDSFLKHILLLRKCKRLEKHNQALIKENQTLKEKKREKEKLIKEYKKVIMEIYYESKFTYNK